jgi:LacI family transcriptional regulator
LQAASVQSVAKRAGVSPSSVSRVFNNKPNVSPAMKEKVLRAAEELGFVPRVYNHESKPSVAGYVAVIHSPRLTTMSDDSFYGEAVRAAEQLLGESGYRLFLRSLSGHVEYDLQIIDELMVDDELKGIIVVGCGIDRRLIRRLKSGSNPLVLLDNELWDEGIDCVVSDNVVGARKAMDHLIGLGHRRIAFLGGPPSHYSMDERYLGYQLSLKQAGINECPSLVAQPEGTTADMIYGVALNMFRAANPIPTAVFAPNDWYASSAMRALRELGYSVPGDISVVGFDDLSLAGHTVPPLTTVRVYRAEMGDLAAKRLLELMKGRSPKPVKLVVSVELVVRESTASVSSSARP